ncbi:hypothetical protein SSX86_008039 [Deinandra increscens subsp. villosa]|uniref:ATP-dependent DNA helicase n=1 Tax=Deinandra increscens subsp. villosa TaxID=3103831 RepID=A0AAP0H6G0_9ASTR
MTNGHSKDRNDASTSNAEKRKEYNARHYALRRENRQPQADINVASTSSASTEKRKLSNARDYDEQRENNKVLKVGTNDVSQSNGSHMAKENVSGTPARANESTRTTTFPYVVDKSMPLTSRAEKQKEYQARYYASRKENRQPQDPNVASTSRIRHDNVEDDPYNFVYDGIPRDHHVLKAMNPCDHCGAKRFPSEFATFCCMSGKTKLANSEIPHQLYRLFTSQDEIGKTFRYHIRAYNTNFSFTSMGVTLDRTVANMREGVYTFRAHKGIYHQISPLVSNDGVPSYLQFYFYDPDTELNLRLQWPNLDRNITAIVRGVLSTNPYVNTFRSLAKLGPLDNYRVTLNASTELDQRVYNRPTTSEVAGIWVEGNDNITSYKRSIVVYGRSEHNQTIQHYGCYDPLSYPLFSPNGEEGLHPNIPRQGESMIQVQNNEDNIDEEREETNTSHRRTTVSMREDYCYKFQVRSTDNVLLFGGKLLQQFIVDLYQGIVDCVNAGEVTPNRIGRRIVLPASFIGGPRDMRRRFLDAMTIVQDDGKPDLFLTMTCNPNWPEISNNLKVCQAPQDRADLVSRVFRAKFVYDEIMRHVNSESPGVFFIDGPGGTGKTFLYKALLAEVRSRGLIALATTSSGASANNMPGGRTAHSRFKIPIKVEKNSMCNIGKQSGAAEVIRSSKLIIWDEASMAKRQAIEAVDRTLQDITGVNLPFGGKVMVMGGDFRQVLPVIKRGTQA